MLNSVRTLVAVLLSATFAQAAPVCAHRHDELSPQQLAVHLRLSHRDADEQIPPHDWHTHGQCLDAIVGDSPEDRRSEVAGDSTSAEEKLCDLLGLASFDRPCPNIGCAAASRRRARDLSWSETTQRALLTRHCVLLI
ncbi:MAG: hypothetical protein JNL96_02175 [Planctomycetaceae bacterium]|nr:hypothetical protein [Planctomycetaceae bacterium]